MGDVDDGRSRSKMKEDKDTLEGNGNEGIMNVNKQMSAGRV